MFRASTKTWTTLLAAGGLVFASTLIDAPIARACTLPIADIMNGTHTTCTEGDKAFSFQSSGIDPMMSSGNVNITSAGAVHTVTYSGFSSPLTDLTIYFEYTVNVLPSSPDKIVALASSVGTISAAQALPTTFASVTFSHGVPDTQSLSSFTNTITQTPAPLPLLGAGAALGFSRKLRKRIHGASRTTSPPA